MQEEWPEIPYEPWRETCTALHLYMQIVGKYRLARTPWMCHSWHATLYPAARGFTTSLVPEGAGAIEVSFDLIDHLIVATSTDGRREGFPLAAMSVASFNAQFTDLVKSVGGTAEWHSAPNEVANPVAFADDTAVRPYDRDAMNRYFRAVIKVTNVFQTFRTAFIGKASPVHQFWGSMDLAVTRFSGRPAPLHRGGIPNLPDEVTREAYSHEVSSAGFWPGGAGIDFPAFYAYAYPAPKGFDAAPIAPAAAYFDNDLGEFLLPYDAVRRADDPTAKLLIFLESTYRAAADLGGWDVSALDCELGKPGQPRPL